MSRYRIPTSLLPVLILLAGAMTHAAETRNAPPPARSAVPGAAPPVRSVAPGTPAAQPVPGSAQAAPLKSEIRLGPGSKYGLPAMHVVAQVSLEKLNQQYAEFSGSAKSYEGGAKALPEIAKQCAAKAYGVQDQMAAGCTGSDTLNQCMDKLYKHCVKNYSAGGVSLPGGGINPVTGQQYGGGQLPGFSTAQFLQSAQMTAAQARALSQQLSQYANQVEQNANALIP